MCEWGELGTFFDPGKSYNAHAIAFFVNLHKSSRFKKLQHMLKYNVNKWIYEDLSIYESIGKH